jgi:uncharacterized protein YndB with AHSA1/START domain
MQTITVKHTIKAPIEKVFDIIADHANYKLLPGVKDSKLIKLGSPTKNGVGAVRWIDAGLARFTEEIVRYERPTRLDYQIVKSFPPVEHRCGIVRLEKSPDGTVVTWTSTIEAKVPVLGRLLTPILASQLSKGFLHTLQAIERRLAA